MLKRRHAGKKWASAAAEVCSRPAWCPLTDTITLNLTKWKAICRRMLLRDPAEQKWISAPLHLTFPSKLKALSCKDEKQSSFSSLFLFSLSITSPSLVSFLSLLPIFLTFFPPTLCLCSFLFYTHLLILLWASIPNLFSSSVLFSMPSFPFFPSHLKEPCSFSSLKDDLNVQPQAQDGLLSDFPCIFAFFYFSSCIFLTPSFLPTYSPFFIILSSCVFASLLWPSFLPFRVLFLHPCVSF